MIRTLVTLALIVVAVEAFHRARFAKSHRRMTSQLRALGVL